MHWPVLTLFMSLAQAYMVPSTPGPYSVAMREQDLTDLNRLEPNPKANKGEKRRIMTSVYLPIESGHHCEKEVLPYMPSLTADVFGKLGEADGIPDGLIQQFKVDFCDISTIHGDKYEKPKQYPLAIYTGGIGSTRYMYSAFARSLASWGYIVITLDHPYESSIVEFPDGTVITSNLDNSTEAIENYIAIRRDDISFLADQLSNTTVTDMLFDGFPGTFDPERLVIEGHSLGGTAAVASAPSESRIIGCLNLDGDLDHKVVWDAVANHSFAKPLVMVHSQQSRDADFFQWDKMYSNASGPRAILNIHKAQHLAFADVVLLMTAGELPEEGKELRDEFIGTIDGRLMESVLNNMTIAFMELVYNKNTAPLKDIGKVSEVVEIMNMDL